MLLLDYYVTKHSTVNVWRCTRPSLLREKAWLRAAIYAFGWCAYVHTCALLKWLPSLPYEQKNALALQRSSFRENTIYFLTSIRRWVCELVFDAIYDWKSEFSHNRQTTTVTLAAHARRGLITVNIPVVVGDDGVSGENNCTT